MVVAPPKDKTDVALVNLLVFQGSFSFCQKQIIHDLDLKDFSTTLFGVFLSFIVVAFSKATYSAQISMWCKVLQKKVGGLVFPMP